MFEASFSDVVGTTFDGAETVEYKQSDDDSNREYKFARVSGVERDSVDVKIDELEDAGLGAAKVEASAGLQVEVWE